MKTIVIQGSSRSFGNTYRIVQLLSEQMEVEVVDLNQKKIAPFDYEFENRTDDFLPLIRRITEYDLIIFATPVYWYTMSGIMKNFFDRITDCLKLEKDTGRKLRGKSMAVISVGSDSEQTEGFFNPFRLSAGYLGMHYLGDVHTWIEGEETLDHMRERIEAFVKQISK